MIWFFHFSPKKRCFSVFFHHYFSNCNKIYFYNFFNIMFIQFSKTCINSNVGGFNRIPLAPCVRNLSMVNFTMLLTYKYFWYTFYFTYYSSYIIWTIFPVQNYTDNKISLQSKFKLLPGWGSDLTLKNINFEMASFKTTFGYIYKMSVSLSKRLQLPPRLYKDIIRS